MVAIIPTPNIGRVCINKIIHCKTLHLVVEINQALLKGLVDTRAIMLVMVASVAKKLGIMHLVSMHETYKITSSIITKALGRIPDIPVTMGKMVDQMVFLVVETNNYDRLLRLNFLMKIGVVVDVEKGVIQIRNGPGVAIEMLPFNVVNML
jgi:predicted aspartyl protease